MTIPIPMIARDEIMQGVYTTPTPLSLISGDLVVFTCCGEPFCGGVITDIEGPNECKMGNVREPFGKYKYHWSDGNLSLRITSERLTIKVTSFDYARVKARKWVISRSSILTDMGKENMMALGRFILHNPSGGYVKQKVINNDYTRENLYLKGKKCEL